MENGRLYLMRLVMSISCFSSVLSDVRLYWLLDFQPPAAYLGDKQMLRILGRGHSVPTVTELIFVRAQCLTILLFKHFALCGTITGSHRYLRLCFVSLFSGWQCFLSPCLFYLVRSLHFELVTEAKTLDP
jgi:hypothetical protein